MMAPIRISEHSGLATVRIGRPITAEEVADALDDD
jgi:hypothetical protein